MELLKFHRKKLEKILSYFPKFLKNHVFSDKTVGWEMPIIKQDFFVVKHENRFPEQVESLSGLFGSLFMAIQCFNLVESKLGKHVIP